MSDTTPLERVEELLHEAYFLPHGETKTAIIQEAVRFADVAGDLDAQFNTRMQLISAATFSGQGEKTLVAFSWCVSQYNRDEARFADWTDDLGWYFKFVIGAASDFPNITRADVDRIVEQMKTHYRRNGHTMRGVYSSLLNWSLDIGDMEQASRMMPLCKEEPRDYMADCEACELNTLVQYYEQSDDPRQAIETAEPLLDGRLSCGEMPHVTLATVLRPLSLLGRFDEADACQTRGYRMIRNNPEFLPSVADHMIYLVNRGRTQAAVNMMQRHLLWALNTHEQRPRYLFYVAADRVLTVLEEERPSAALKLPELFTKKTGLDDPTLPAVMTWLKSEITGLAERFDARNGSDYFSRRLVEATRY